MRKISFIKEGEFVEKGGAPTLRLVGDVQTIETGKMVVAKTKNCRYVSKRAATPEEIRRSKENKKAEAIRGGRKEF